MIRVLVVDDSEVFRRFLGTLLETDPQIRVTGTASGGREAFDLLRREASSFDVVLMDLQMPGWDGLETTRRIMETCPLPIVMVSAVWAPEEIDLTFRAMEAGAVEIASKPREGESPEEYGAELAARIRAAAVARVRRPPLRHRGTLTVVPPPPRTLRVVALGASTGGPQAVATLLGHLPGTFPLPLLLVQHITPGFEEGFADWLDRSGPLRVRLARRGDDLIPGQVLVAPAGTHLELDPSCRVLLTQAPPEHGVRPAASVLFRSVTRRFGGDAAAVLLSGMGTDGAQEMRLLRDRGGTTFAQDAPSSLIWGMPGEAVRLAGAEQVLPPERIAAALAALARRPDEDDAPPREGGTKP